MNVGASEPRNHLSRLSWWACRSFCRPIGRPQRPASRPGRCRVFSRPASMLTNLVNLGPRVVERLLRGNRRKLGRAPPRIGGAWPVASRAGFRAAFRGGRRSLCLGRPVLARRSDQALGGDLERGPVCQPWRRPWSCAAAVVVRPAASDSGSRGPILSVTPNSLGRTVGHARFNADLAVGDFAPRPWRLRDSARRRDGPSMVRRPGR